MAVHSPARCCLVIAIIAFSIAGCVGYRFGNNTLYAPSPTAELWKTEPTVTTQRGG